MNRSCVPSGARWMQSGVLFELSLLLFEKDCPLCHVSDIYLYAGTR
jgi:hypothetical protein